MKKFFLSVLTVMIFLLIFTTISMAETEDGYTVYTDVVTYINNYPIPSYSYNNMTLVYLDDLKNYGFTDTGSYEHCFCRNDTDTISALPTMHYSFLNNGQKQFPIYNTNKFKIHYGHTNIILSSFVGENDKILINTDDLKVIPDLTISWDEYNRALKIWIEDGLQYSETMEKTIWMQPFVKMYAPDGRTENVPDSDVATWERVGWYTYPVQTLYAYDGRTQVFPKDRVYEQLTVGWYIEPVKKVYDLAWLFKKPVQEAINIFGSNYTLTQSVSIGDYYIIEYNNNVTFQYDKYDGIIYDIHSENSDYGIFGLKVGMPMDDVYQIASSQGMTATCIDKDFHAYIVSPQDKWVIINVRAKNGIVYHLSYFVNVW